MIEINLLPGDKKKGRRRSGGGAGAATMLADLKSRIKDPYLIAAAASVLLAAGVIGGLHVTQDARATELGDREATAVRDSSRFAAVLAERRRVVASRDSLRRQIEIIRVIDDDRFVWAHIMDEVSSALPPYTWLKSLQALASAAPSVVPSAPAPGAEKQGPTDPTHVAEAPRFRVIGYTVDIQALTRFIRGLEASPYVKNVTLARSDLVTADGKQVTEFQLDADYERPEALADASTIPAAFPSR